MNESTAGRLVAARALPFIPVIAALAVVYVFSVNVPYGDEWALIPFIERLRVEGWSWSGALVEPRMGIKFVAAVLALATDFDVTAQMYAGIVFQCAALIFLWSVLELTLRAWHRPLIFPLSILLALLMFSPAESRYWLTGLTSLQWGMSNFVAAISIWTLSRWPTKVFRLGLCLFLTWLVMGLAYAVVLWNIILVVKFTRSLTKGTVQWRPLTGLVFVTVLVVTTYIAGLLTSADALQNFGLAPLFHSMVFVLTDLGWPLTQSANAWVVGGAGLIGVTLLFLRVVGWRGEMYQLVPWLMLSSYALLSAIVASTHVKETNVRGTVEAYSTGTLFWIGFFVVGTLSIRRISRPHEWLRRGRSVAAIAMIVLGVNYVRLCSSAYVAFARNQQERSARLLAVYRSESAGAAALASYYSDSQPTPEHLGILKKWGFGPYSSPMSRQRTQLENATTFSTMVTSGLGYVDTIGCTMISGWASDATHPDASVKVHVYDSDVLLLTAPADWFRGDLLDGGIGNGKHGFVIAPPPSLKDGRAHTIHVKISGSNADLTYSPKTLLCQ